MAEIAVVEIGAKTRATAPIDSAGDIVLAFTARSCYLHYFAFVPAVYGRVNRNHLSVELIGPDERLLFQEDVDCSSLDGDYRYFTAAASLEPGETYFIRLSSGDAANSDMVGLWYGYRTLPYIDFMYVNGERSIGVPAFRFGYGKEGFIYDMGRFHHDIEEVDVALPPKARTKEFGKLVSRYEGEFAYEPSPATSSGLVSIVVLCNDRSLQSALDAIGSQSYRDIEVIVVDNGSSNEVFSCNSDIVSAFAESGMDIRMIASGEQVEDWMAFNAGDSMAHGEFLVNIDSSVVLYSDFVERCVGQTSSCDAVYTDFICGMNRFRSRQVDEGNFLESPWCTYVFLSRRSSFPGFSGGCMDCFDWECCIRMFKSGARFYFIGEVMYVSPNMVGMMTGEGRETVADVYRGL